MTKLYIINLIKEKNVRITNFSYPYYFFIIIYYFHVKIINYKGGIHYFKIFQVKLKDEDEVEYTYDG